MKKNLIIVLLSLVCASVFLVGCGNEPSSQAAVDPAIRGERIEKLEEKETAQVEGAPEQSPKVESVESSEVNVVSKETAIATVETVEEANESVEVAKVDEVEPEVAVEKASSSELQMIESGGRDYRSVGFDFLASYEFEMSDDLLETGDADPAELTDKTNSMIPDTVRKLDASSVAVKGYMLPLKVEQGQVTEFLLMRDQSMCCFGTVPKINEWVSVKTIGSGVKAVMDEPVTIFGKLHVGEIRENGYLVGIYRMDGEKLAGALDL